MHASTVWENRPFSFQSTLTEPACSNCSPPPPPPLGQFLPKVFGLGAKLLDISLFQPSHFRFCCSPIATAMGFWPILGLGWTALDGSGKCPKIGRCWGCFFLEPETTLSLEGVFIDVKCLLWTIHLNIVVYAPVMFTRFGSQEVARHRQGQGQG